jgi:hypothetical protein
MSNRIGNRTSTSIDDSYRRMCVRRSPRRWRWRQGGGPLTLPPLASLPTGCDSATVGTNYTAKSQLRAEHCLTPERSPGFRAA